MVRGHRIEIPVRPYTTVVQYCCAVGKNIRSYNVPSEVLIGQLFHTQEVFLPILFRHNDRVLNEKLHYNNKKD